MPHHKSAKKRLKTNETSRKRNLAVKSFLRKRLKEQRDADGETAVSMLPSSYSELDKAARKGVIPQKRADRIKGRLARAAQK